MVEREGEGSVLGGNNSNLIKNVRVDKKPIMTRNSSMSVMVMRSAREIKTDVPKGIQSIKDKQTQVQQSLPQYSYLVMR